MKKSLIIIILTLTYVLNVNAQGADSLAYNPFQSQKEQSFQSPTDYASQLQTGNRKFSIKQSFNRNATYAGLIFIADGLIVKAQKKDFRTIKTFFQPHFKESYDNYIQYAPVAATFALKALGVKSASSWKRMTLNSALSYILMAGFVNGVKYTSKEMRPDNSSNNSFPSGHTATAFAGATIFQKEYGYLSPWYTAGGYAVATLTGITRIMNNRHWISDVLVGAGLGIVSTDLGYMLGDLILKGKGVQHKAMNDIPDISENGSFLSLTVGSSFGSGHLTAPDVYDQYKDDMTPNGHAMNLVLQTGRSSSVNIEGAYYLNKYFGVGGRLKASALPVAVESFNSDFNYNVETGGSLMPENLFKLEGLESSHLGMIDVSVGANASLPIGRRLRVGTKLLVGNRLTTDYSVDAIFSCTNTVTKNLLDDYIGSAADTKGDITHDEIDPNLYHNSDFMEIKANNALTIGTGLSLTYAVKKDVSFMLNLDYDYANPKYTFVLHNRYSTDVTNAGVIDDTFEEKTRMNFLNLNFGMSIVL